MSDAPFISFLLISSTHQGMTTFVARINAERSEEFSLGPVQAAETVSAAAKLAALAKDGFGHELLSLARHPTEISHAKAQLSCSVNELLNLGFRKA